MKQAPKEPIDRIEDKARELRKKDSDAGLQVRCKPEFVKEMYDGLKNEVDYINNKPENRKYLEDFNNTKKAYDKRGKNLMDLLEEGLKTLNLTATTGKAKFDKNKARPVDYNNSDIDGKGVFLLLNELGLIEPIGKLQPKYLQGQVIGQKEMAVDDGIAVNEKQIGEQNGLDVRDPSKQRKAINFIKKGENPFKDTIIAINNNIKNSDGPTSSTRMIYEVLKQEGVLQKYPKDMQEQLNKFVYFVDIAYRLKQRVIGMDFPYIHRTIFGNYKHLNIYDIYDYLENPEKTGFELVKDQEAEKFTAQIGEKVTKVTEGKKEDSKEYVAKDLLSILNTRGENVAKAMEGMDKIRNNVVYYKPKNNEHKEQKFVFDINERVQNSEDLAGFLAAAKLGFCKLHPNNEIFIRSYYDLPKHFGPFMTESANTLHGKLTDDNIEGFLKLLEIDEDIVGAEKIKDRIREQFQKNTGIKIPQKETGAMDKLPTSQDVVPKVGKTYKGVITNKKDFGIFIQISKGENPKKGLLHVSQLNEKKITEFKEGDQIDVVLKEIRNGKLDFSLPKPVKEQGKKLGFKLENMMIGDVFEGKISNITKGGLVFIKIKNYDVSGILETNVPKEEVENVFTIDTPIKVRLVAITKKGPVFKITQTDK